jgi:hypothetical protein
MGQRYRRGGFRGCNNCKNGKMQSCPHCLGQKQIWEYRADNPRSNKKFGKDATEGTSGQHGSNKIDSRGNSLAAGNGGPLLET